MRARACVGLDSFHCIWGPMPLKLYNTKNHNSKLCTKLHAHAQNMNPETFGVSFVFESCALCSERVPPVSRPVLRSDSTPCPASTSITRRVARGTVARSRMCAVHDAFVQADRKNKNSSRHAPEFSGFCSGLVFRHEPLNL